MSIHGSVIRNEPCPECGSRDNVARYETGYAKCFGNGCTYWESAKDDSAVHSGDGGGDLHTVHAVHDSQSVRAPSKPLIELTFAEIEARGLSEETCKKFGYGIGETEFGVPVQVASYGNAQKWRTREKKFGWINRPSEGPKLFGQSLWGPGRMLVVTEGEIDALSYAEATGCRYPVVSVPDGAQDAPRAIARNLEWVSQFDKVIFLFDMDTPGQSAAVKCAELLPPGKAFIGVLSKKDANEVLLEVGSTELYQVPFKAKPWRPEGIVQGIELLEAVLRDPEAGLGYPWPFLNSFAHGQRRREMVTWIAGTGVGKSAVMREISLHLWQEHGEKVGVIALEESNQRSALGLISLVLEKPLHVPAVRAGVSKEEMEMAAKAVLPGFVFYDHWGSVEAEVLLPKIRYMAHALGIRWFVLDHLSIMVSGMAAEGDERKRLDQLTTQLRSLCSELDIGLHIVSHLRKATGKAHEEGGRVSLQDIRGSGAPAQLSDFVIALERNQQEDDEDERNKTQLRVLKNRLTGETGLAGTLVFNKETCRLTAEDDVDVNF